MTLVLVGGLVLLSFYLAKRLFDVNTENTALRNQVASLKKQLVRRRS
jgi:hypothetical protein